MQVLPLSVSKHSLMDPNQWESFAHELLVNPPVADEGMHNAEWQVLVDQLIGGPEGPAEASMDASEWASLADDLLGGTEMNAEEVFPQAFAEVRPRRGRPLGSYGGRVLRGQMQAQRHAQPAQLEEARNLDEQQLVPGSAAYAREHKRRKTEERQLVAAVPCDGRLPGVPLHGMGVGAWALIDKLACTTDVQEASLRVARAQPPPTDETRRGQDSLLGELFDESRRSITSVSAMAEKHNVHRATTVSLMRSAACAVVESGRALWGVFFQALNERLDSGDWSPVLFCSRCRYDETPTLTRMAAKKAAAATAAKVELQGSEASPHSKVVQGEGSFHVVVRDRQKRFIEFRGVVPCLLQMVQSTNAESLKRARINLMDMASIPNMSNLQQRFSWQLQAATVDRYAANMKAERSLLHDSLSGLSDTDVETAPRAPPVSKLTLPCDVHKAHQCTTAAISLLDADVSGLLSTNLSQHGAGTLQTLRDILTGIFEHRLNIYRETPPEGRGSCLDSACSNVVIRKACKAVRLSKGLFAFSRGVGPYF